MLFSTVSVGIVVVALHSRAFAIFRMHFEPFSTKRVHMSHRRQLFSSSLTKMNNHSAHFIRNHLFRI